MRIINNVLFYTDEDIRSIPKSKTFEDVIPKGKYYTSRKFEDCAHKKEYTVGNQKVTQKFITKPGIMNREQRRNKDRQLKMKGHKLEYHHNQIRKRREKKS